VTSEALTDDAISDCSAPMQPYCSNDAGDSLICPEDCFGEPSLATGSDICQASATAVGRLAARCEAPVLQPSFAFNTEASSAEQASFSELVVALNEPLTTLFALLVRIDLLETANAELLSVAADARSSAGDLGGESQVCAEATVSLASPWLADQGDALQEVRDEILAVTSVLTINRP
jgi:hypothetical protein